MEGGRSPMDRFANAVYNLLDGPVTFVHDKIVKPNQQYYPWYHQKFRRVPTIDTCYTDDPVCFFEANIQFRRDKAVDSEILNIMRNRYEDCVVYHGIDIEKCKPLHELYEDAAGAWFAKYGDLGAKGNVKVAFMKQKHRMVWERRHGPVGSGMKTDD
ncbi:NADH dehydrogenase [ubiquinone] 1 beta subcomplex subunit 10 [Cephus cinctus]|uniref:NADH dehydrogenase [ubiquinone] 1 beta subcomplex subunit 10 n=1 Tax=Cephus cinctus TaxID=211228 RepID=A0AAJ7FF18_CEPCN|nr:NADH dehydrogenase [ubiquinone] 1 beta subcomplex subunit 10 [Cephus cinctus]